jgi:hypothetical protein
MIMNTITHLATLVYYDVPQVIEGRDPIGGHYVGVAIEDDASGPRFMVVGVAPDQFALFKTGHADLRRLIVERPMEDWFIGRWLPGNTHPLSIERQPDHEVDAAFLPENGFFLEVPAVSHVS